MEEIVATQLVVPQRTASINRSKNATVFARVQPLPAVVVAAAIAIAALAAWAFLSGGVGRLLLALVYAAGAVVVVGVRVRLRESGCAAADLPCRSGNAGREASVSPYFAALDGAALGHDGSGS